MKVFIKSVPPGSDKKVGDQVELEGDELSTVLASGFAATETEWNMTIKAQQAEQATIKAREVRIDKAIAQAITDGRFLPKEDTASVKARAVNIEAAQEGDGVAYIGSLPVKAGQATGRTVAALKDDGTGFSGIKVTKASLEDMSQGVIRATEPQNNLIKTGRMVEAQALAKDAAFIMQQMVKAHGDFMLRDTVKAATFSDPNSQVGSLAGDLVIMRNLGYLVNKLAWLKYLTTDLSSEPCKFGATILTRYLTPPGVLTWVPGTGFTSDTGTISGASGTTTQSGETNAAGTVVKSVPSSPDVSVALNMFKATEVEFPVSLLAGTVRNLFSEQLGAQTYGLAEAINKYVLGVLFGATWSGTVTSYVQTLANWTVKDIIGIKNKLTISKVPDLNRFLLLHSFYYDKTLEDASLLQSKVLMALVNKDESEWTSGELPPLYGIKPMESQLASATTGGVLTTWTDDTTPSTTVKVGFAGNQSSALFLSRPPQDFTTIATQLGVPVTASVRLMTEPDSGLTVMVFSYADNGKMSISQRVCLMWGAAQGDPRVGIVVRLSA